MILSRPALVLALSLVSVWAASQPPQTTTVGLRVVRQEATASGSIVLTLASGAQIVVRPDDMVALGQANKAAATSSEAAPGSMPPAPSAAPPVPQAPAAPSAPPPGATARCRDGSYSHSKSRNGTCSGHGGVAQWL